MNKVLRGLKGDPGENATDSQVQNAVDKYMTDHPFESVGVDATLTQSGQAADAKATGDKILQYAIKNTASGESPLVIPDSAEEKILDFRLTGNTQQVSTTGAQLLDKDTFFFNSPTTFDQLKYYPFNIGDKECTLSTTCPISSNVANLFLLPGNVDNGASSSVNGVGFGVSRTAKSQDGYVTIALRTNGDNPYNPLDYDIMLNYGSAATAYEPYTGGKPSPSPEYPQEIVSAGKLNEGNGKYEIKVKFTGKNLFDVEKAKIFENWTPSTQNGKSGYLDFPIYIGKGNKFTISIKAPAEKVPELYLCLALKKYGGNAGWLYHATSTYNTCLIKVAEEDYVFLRCIKEKVSDLTNIVQEIQVEISPNQTTYEPYKEQTLTLTSDRPITKWDRLVEQGGQIGWLYEGGNTKLTKISTQYPNEDLEGKTFSRFETTIKPGFDAMKRFETLCTKLRIGSTDDDVFFNTLGNGNIVLYFNKNLAVDDVQKANAWILSNSDIEFLYCDLINASTFVPFPQSEQDAIRALTTYYPTTVITADGGEVEPNVEATYIADTKNFILEQLNPVKASLANTQAQLL